MKINEIFENSNLVNIYEKWEIIKLYKQASNCDLCDFENRVNFRISLKVEQEKISESHLGMKYKKLKKFIKRYKYAIEPCFKLLQMMKHYQINTKLNDSSEEFYRLFKEQGTGISLTLSDYMDLIRTIYAYDSHNNFQSIRHPSKLAAKTLTFNEINVKLDTPCTRPTEVKGLLFGRNAIEKWTKTEEGVNYHPEFSLLMRYAKEQNLPIYILDKTPPKAKL